MFSSCTVIIMEQYFRAPNRLLYTHDSLFRSIKVAYYHTVNMIYFNTPLKNVQYSINQMLQNMFTIL